MHLGLNLAGRKSQQAPCDGEKGCHTTLWSASIPVLHSKGKRAGPATFVVPLRHALRAQARMPGNGMGFINAEVLRHVVSYRHLWGTVADTPYPMSMLRGQEHSY